MASTVFNNPKKVAVSDLVSPVKTGWLTKQGHIFKSWKKRYFVMKDKRLYYFEGTDSKKAQGIIFLEGYIIELVDKPEILGKVNKSKDHGLVVFNLFHEFKPEYLLCAESEEELIDWMKSIILEQFREFVVRVQLPDDKRDSLAPPDDDVRFSYREARKSVEYSSTQKIDTLKPLSDGGVSLTHGPKKNAEQRKTKSFLQDIFSFETPIEAQKRKQEEEREKERQRKEEEERRKREEEERERRRREEEEECQKREEEERERRRREEEEQERRKRKEEEREKRRREEEQQKIREEAERERKRKEEEDRRKTLELKKLEEEAGAKETRRGRERKAKKRRGTAEDTGGGRKGEEKEGRRRQKKDLGAEEIGRRKGAKEKRRRRKKKNYSSRRREKKERGAKKTRRGRKEAKRRRGEAKDRGTRAQETR
eukprot:TRINITY_DN1033_c0_g1_i1.p1 TRINITY_DN1033_c0_g1~~TRINITY_DN1033_c0_g1_i1.p1  ORF type:complete len:436 (-),score=185.52 TRINITY_DN1033_c0_g1_i1:170-1444(-)